MKYQQRFARPLSAHSASYCSENDTAPRDVCVEIDCAGKKFFIPVKDCACKSEMGIKVAAKQHESELVCFITDNHRIQFSDTLVFWDWLDHELVQSFDV